jgi:predicted nucleic acid-binding protein
VRDEDVRRVFQEVACRPIMLPDALVLLPDAMRIALSTGWGICDALYVALAPRENAPVLTADERLVRGLAGTKLERLAQPLGDLWL